MITDADGTAVVSDCFGVFKFVSAEEVSVLFGSCELTQALLIVPNFKGIAIAIPHLIDEDGTQYFRVEVKDVVLDHIKERETPND